VDRGGNGVGASVSERSRLSVKARDRLKVGVWVLFICGLWTASTHPKVYVDDGAYQVGDEFTYPSVGPVHWRCDQDTVLHLGKEPPKDAELPLIGSVGGVEVRGYNVWCPAGEWSPTNGTEPATYEIQLPRWLREDESDDPGVIRTRRELVWWRAWLA
jgi:hypothetical protein